MVVGKKQTVVTRLKAEAGTGGNCGLSRTLCISFKQLQTDMLHSCLGQESIPLTGRGYVTKLKPHQEVTGIWESESSFMRRLRNVKILLFSFNLLIMVLYPKGSYIH